MQNYEAEYFQWQVKPDCQERLIFFPFAGGTGEYYLPWFRHIDSDIQCAFAQLPGRGRLFEQPAFDDLSQLIDELLPQALELADKPLSLFGHSMGGLIAYTLAQRLQQLGVQVKRLFVSAHRAPCLAYQRDFLHKMSEPELIEAIAPMCGLADMDKEWLQAFLPTLYADFKLCELYQYKDTAALHSPITALWGVEDEFIQKEHMSQWRQESIFPVNLQPFCGDHFYINQHSSKIVNLINQQLITIKECA